MPCTTVLVGRMASNDGSTLIARNDDCPSGSFHVKRLTVMSAEKQPRHYVSVIAHLALDLPDNPLSYTMTPNVDPKDGIWAASGVNSANVAMTATETITTNPRVLGADPYVEYHKAENGKPEISGGIGEEDLVVLVLPYIHSAREGVIRLGNLLQHYGTYEPNGIAFSDGKEIWWLETIGGHHFIARKVPDDRVVIMPNQLGIDEFDLTDATGAQKDNIASQDIIAFVKENALDLSSGSTFKPRLAFGSGSDSDHVYNTPRAWFMGRYLCPTTIRWDGDEADYTPLADDIPWSLVPEHKITVEDVKYLLSSHYQGTPYDPYARFGDPSMHGAYRPIGVNRTSVLSLYQIRPNVPAPLAAIEWVAFGSNVFNAMVPLYGNVASFPAYFSETPAQFTSENFYWASRLLGALADPHFGFTTPLIERYQDAVASLGHDFLNRSDAAFLAAKTKDGLLLAANAEMAKMAQEQTDIALDKLLFEVSLHMKNGYARSDN